MNRRGQAVQRLVSFVVQRKDSSGMVPRIGNALIKATYEGTVKAGGVLFSLLLLTSFALACNPCALLSVSGPCCALHCFPFLMQSFTLLL